MDTKKFEKMLEEKQAELQKVVGQIQNGKQQIAQLEAMAIELNGQVKMLTDIISPPKESKPVKKPVKK